MTERQPWARIDERQRARHGTAQAERPRGVAFWHITDIEREVQEVRFYLENGHSLGRVATSGYRDGR